MCDLLQEKKLRERFYLVITWIYLDKCEIDHIAI